MVTDVVVFRSPRQRHLGVGDIDYVQPQRRQTRYVGGVERAYCPVGDAGGVAILADMVDVAVAIDKTVEGIERVGDKDVVQNPTVAVGTTVAEKIAVADTSSPAQGDIVGTHTGREKPWRLAAVRWAHFQRDVGPEK